MTNNPDKYFLIGSQRLKELFPESERDPKDCDYLVQEKLKEYPSLGAFRTEYHIIPPLWNYLINNNFTEVNKDILLTLKVSHIFWDIFWAKHMYDILFLKSKGAEIVFPLFYELYDHWNEVHSKNVRSDLKMTKADFFDNAMKKYDHDSLHYLLNPEPIFTKILKDGQEVDVSEEKFNKLPFEDKLDLVREEVMVMAFERFQTQDYRIAYSKMLKKFIISHAPLWEVFFILDNHKFLYKPTFDYFKFLHSKLEK